MSLGRVVQDMVGSVRVRPARFGWVRAPSSVLLLVRVRAACRHAGLSEPEFLSAPLLLSCCATTANQSGARACAAG